MPNSLDRAMDGRNIFLGFAGAIAAAAMWSIWGQDMFPKQAEPTGDPENWTLDEMKSWLKNRGLDVGGNGVTKQELLARIKSAEYAPK